MVLNFKKVVACVACLLVTGQTTALPVGGRPTFKSGRGLSPEEQMALDRESSRELLERQVLDSLLTETSSRLPKGVLNEAAPTHMAYWRGRAYWDIGLFGDAEMDFLGLQNHVGVRTDLIGWALSMDPSAFTVTARFPRPEYRSAEFMRLSESVDLSSRKLRDSTSNNYLRQWLPELRSSIDYLNRLDRIKALLPHRATFLPTLEPAYYGNSKNREKALPLYFEHHYYTDFNYIISYSRTETSSSGQAGMKSFAVEALNQGRGNIRGGLSIYHDEDAAEDEWTQGVMSTLEKAYTQAKSSIFGSDVPLVTVFIFRDRARYDAFFKEYHGAAPKAQEWITYNRGVMMICPRDKDRSHIAPNDVTSDYFRSTIAQVYVHCLLRRALGTTEVPSWLNNGLAMTLASKLVPEDEKLNDYAIKRLVAADALFDVETLAKVPASTQYMTDKDDATKGALQQSYHITRYLLQSSKGDGVVSFFNRAVNNEQTVEQSFEETYGASPEAFYASWLANVQKTFGGTATQPLTPVQ
jgi:hypothetical protein